MLWINSGIDYNIDCMFGMKEGMCKLKIHILKCHGTGNDFVLIDEINSSLGWSDRERAVFARRICDRKGTIGADGILFVQYSSAYDAKMRIFNSDGSEAEMCGNGLRCVGRYVMEKINRDAADIETMRAVYTVKRGKDIYPGIWTVEILIDTVSFNTSDLPMVGKGDKLVYEKIEQLSGSLEFTAVSITNPHIISVVEHIDEDLLVSIGKRANSAEYIFPKGVNVSFVSILNKNSIYVKTYERGVGLTKSCGTGMTASCAAVCLKFQDMINSEINVYNDGGMIKCIVNRNSLGNYEVRFTGNATFVYSAEIDYMPDEPGFYNQFEKETFTQEIELYDNFIKHIAQKI